MATWGSPASLRGVDGGSTSNDGLRCLKNENIFFFTLYYRGSDFPEHWCGNSRVTVMTDIVYLVSTLCYYKSFSNGENYVIHQLSKHTQRVVLKQPRVYLQLFYQTFIRCCRALLTILCKCQKCRRGEKAAKQRRVFNSTRPDSPQRQKRAPSLFPGKHFCLTPTPSSPLTHHPFDEQLTH